MIEWICCNFFEIILNIIEDFKSVFECVRMLVIIYLIGGYVNGV